MSQTAAPAAAGGGGDPAPAAETPEALKLRGNELFSKKEYAEAANCYTAAIKLDGRNATLYSNRAACRLEQGDLAPALSDATRCVKLKPTWAKGYCRKAFALLKLRKYTEAQEVARAGLTFENGNAALLEVLKASIEEQKRATAMASRKIKDDDSDDPAPAVPEPRTVMDDDDSDEDGEECEEDETSSSFGQGDDVIEDLEKDDLDFGEEDTVDIGDGKRGDGKLFRSTVSYIMRTNRSQDALQQDAKLAWKKVDQLKSNAEISRKLGMQAEARERGEQPAAPAQPVNVVQPRKKRRVEEPQPAADGCISLDPKAAPAAAPKVAVP